jgi:hypothetical protein
MRELTNAILREMTRWPLLGAIGKPLPLCKPGYATGVNNWRDASLLCNRDQWSSLQLQVKNRISRTIREKAFSRSLEWNQIADQVRPIIGEFVEGIQIKIEAECDVRNIITASISWDLMMICMEIEYSNIMVPFFFVPNLKSIYQEGHFPCGWSGKKISEKWASLSDNPLPPGKILIY